RIERIAAEARIDRLVNDILGERGRRKSYPRATQKDCGSTNRATTRRHWTPYRTSVALLAPPIRCQVFPVPAIAKVNEGLVTSDPIRIPHSGEKLGNSLWIKLAVPERHSRGPQSSV